MRLLWQYQAFLIYLFLFQKDFARTKKVLKSTKSAKGTKSTKSTKSTKAQPSKSTKRK